MSTESAKFFFFFGGGGVIEGFLPSFRAGEGGGGSGRI